MPEADAELLTTPKGETSVMPSQKNPQSPLALEYIRALRDDRTLTSTEKLAAVFMASHAGHDGANAHPGIELLAAELGLRERQTKTVVGNLANHGWLIQVSSGRGNNRYASVYRIAVPQGATDCTLEDSQGATDCTSIVQSTARQGATHCPTNQPVESPKEIPVSVSHDVTDVGEDLSQTQELTDGQEGASDHSQDPGQDSPASPSPASGTGPGEDSPAGGEAAGDDWTDETPQSILDDIQDIFDTYVEEWKEKPRFDPKFLRPGHSQLLPLLAAAMNRHQFQMYDVLDGMFIDGERRHGLGPAEHNLDRITEPAKFLARILSGDLGRVIAYGERGKKISAICDAARKTEESAAAEAEAAMEVAERELWESTDAERNKILATVPDHVPARVRPLAGARFQTYLDSPSDYFVPVCHHPEFDVVAGTPKRPGPDWITGYMRRADWERIKDQDVIPLRQAA
jgi:hypothetical protein